MYILTYMTCTTRSNPLLTWNCTSLNSIVWIPHENWNLRSPSSRYRYMYILGVRRAYSKMPVGAIVRAVTSTWVPVLLFSLWLRYDRPVKAATLIPMYSRHIAPCQPNLHMHCNRMFTWANSRMSVYSEKKIMKLKVFLLQLLNTVCVTYCLHVTVLEIQWFNCS